MPKIPAAVRTCVWNRFIGEAIGKGECFTGCGSTITQANFHCGHIVARKHGGNTKIENLRPICQRCNTSMGTQNMFDFIEKYGFRMLDPMEVEYPQQTKNMFPTINMYMNEYIKKQS